MFGGVCDKNKICGEGGPKKRKYVGGGVPPPKICKGVGEKIKYVGRGLQKKNVGRGRQIFPLRPLRISNGIALTENDKFSIHLNSEMFIHLFVPAIEINT